MKKIVLYNHFHSGDVILSRTIIEDIVESISSRFSIQLQCKVSRTYLWEDLGLEIVGLKEGEATRGRFPSINLWFGTYPNILASFGLTYQNQIKTYNRQAFAYGLPVIYPKKHKRFVSFKNKRNMSINHNSILLENGPVLSGQLVYDMSPWIGQLADDFPNCSFYCPAPPQAKRSNLIDCSHMNLIDISSLGSGCIAQISRLSGASVACMTEENVGKPRLVMGRPMPCKIWDDDGFEYLEEYDALRTRLSTLMSERSKAA